MKKQIRAGILEYNAIFSPEEEGGFSVYVPDLPGCISQGDSFEDAKKNIKEAIELYLETVDDDLYETTPEQARRQFMTGVQIHV